MILLLLPILLGITFLLVMSLKETFGYMLPVSIMLMSILLYFSQILFNTFVIGIIVVSATGILGLFICTYFMCFKRRLVNDSKTIDFFFSSGFWAFIVLFVYLLIAYTGRHFSAWDELSHWGHMVKEMFRLDKFYIVPEARYMAHKDYPPIIQIFEYLVCFFSGKYSEGNVSFGIQIILLSFIVPFFSEKLFEDKSFGAIYKIISAICILCSVMLIFFIFDKGDYYRTIMVDCAVSAIGVYIISLTLNKRTIECPGRKACVLFSLFYFPLCKQISIAFIALAIFAYLVLLFQNRTEIKWKNEILFVILMILLPVLSLRIWNIIISPYNFEAQFQLSGVSVSDICKIMIGHGSWQQHMTYIRFMKALLDESTTMGLVSMSYLTANFVAIVLLYGLVRRIAAFGSNQLAKELFVRYGIVFVCGTAGYAFTIFVMYMYGFSQGEMLALASFSRYMNTYTVMVYLILLMLLLEYHDPVIKDIRTFLVMLPAILLVLAGTERLADFLPVLYGNELRDYQLIAEDIDSHVEYEDKVLLVSDDNTVYYPFLRYYCDDAILSGDIFSSEIRSADIEKYDYVYVVNTNEWLDSLWEPVLNGDEGFAPGIYKVEANNGEYNITGKIS